MAHLRVYSKTHGKAKLFIDVVNIQGWITGEEIYSLMPSAGTVYPIIDNRTEWKDPIELLDQIAIVVDREFFFEPE